MILQSFAEIRASSSPPSNARAHLRAKLNQQRVSDSETRNISQSQGNQRIVRETYKQYGHDVMQFTSTQKAPWVIVEGNNKMYARLKVLKTIIDHLKERLDRPPEGNH